MKLASRRTAIGDKGGAKIEVIEVRKLTTSSHQTSIISTAYTLKNMEIAVLMFARWCQENFFNYMMQHFAIDGLTDYKKEPVSATTKLTSPQWSRLVKKRNSTNGILKTLQAKVGKITLEIDNLNEDGSDKKIEKAHIKRAEIAEEAAIVAEKLQAIKMNIKETPHYVFVDELPEAEMFQQLSTSKKDLVDTIKMIAYRAETAMATIVLDGSENLTNARSLLQNIFKSDADLMPDYQNKTLEVRLHSLASRCLNEKVDPLIKVLNESEIIYPGTELKMVYSRVGGVSC